MKQSDKAVGKVLAGLQRIEAPHGMDNRILQGAQTRAAHSSAAPWLRLRQLVAVWSRSVPVWSFVLSALVIAAALPTINRRLRTPAQPKSQLNSVARLSSAGAVVSREQARLVRPNLQAATVRKVRRAGVIRNGDSAAFSESQVSFPAPPMPLTDQEKLLLRVVHRADPVEMAMLDSDVRARQNAQGKAEFQQFFDASPQGDKQ